MHEFGQKPKPFEGPEYAGLAMLAGGEEAHPAMHIRCLACQNGRERAGRVSQNSMQRLPVRQITEKLTEARQLLWAKGINEDNEDFALAHLMAT